jgi:hypothetical protein
MSELSVGFTLRSVLRRSPLDWFALNDMRQSFSLDIKIHDAGSDISHDDGFEAGSTTRKHSPPDKSQYFSHVPWSGLRVFHPSKTYGESNRRMVPRALMQPGNANIQRSSEHPRAVSNGSWLPCMIPCYHNSRFSTWEGRNCPPRKYQSFWSTSHSRREHAWPRQVWKSPVMMHNYRPRAWVGRCEFACFFILP